MLNHRSILYSYLANLNPDDLYAIARAQDNCFRAGTQLGTSAQAEAHTQFCEAVENSLSCKSDFYMNELDRKVIRAFGDPLPPVRNEREFVIFAGADGKDREIHVVTETNTLRQAVNKVVIDLARNEEKGTTIFVDLAIESIPEADFYADEIHALSSQKEYEFDYMMLGRLQMDIEYYYGHGGRKAKHLYYDTIEEHIKEMKKLYSKFPDDIKPDWISIEEIENYGREEVIGPMYAVIIECIGGSKTIGHDEQDDGSIMPTLFEKQWEALKDIDDCMNDGLDVSDWSVEKVTVQGDTVTLVDTGETFNWRESIS